MFNNMRGSYSSYRSSGARHTNFRKPLGNNVALRSRFPSRFGRRVDKIDPSMLIRKAEIQDQEDQYIAKNTFNDFQINELLKTNIRAVGYQIPTPIQDQTIPEILNGRDLVGIANTGTGKTAAFLIPIIQKIFTNKGQKVLIVTPTRELAFQILEECEKLSRRMFIYTVLCIGGVNIERQIMGLRRNPAIVVGTPGRLKDLRNRGVLKFSEYNTIVLDEVDRMLDMGFINDIRLIISQLPENRQSLFFSATVSPAIRQIMDSFLKNPIIVSVKKRETASNVDQDIIKTNGQPKLDILHDLLIKDGFDKVLVFNRTKWGVEKLTKQLIDRGFAVESLHGNKTQGQRKRALDNFKSNRVKILLATDVASRGLDIADVTHVINFDLPETYEDYVHRIGRTGRANKKGIALSFID